MKKIIIILIIILLISGGGITYLVIKNNKKNEPLKKINIIFNSDGGSLVNSIELECGKELSLPENPTKEGYIFKYWTDKNGIPIYDNALFTCEKEVVLTAAWEKKEDKTTFEVTFITGIDEEISTMTVNCGETLKLPENPTKEGYVFKFWFDRYGTPILDGALLTCEDIRLQASWDKLPETKSFKVIFDSRGGSSVSPVTVECGKELKLPTNPTKEGYSFRIWEDKHGTPILDEALFTCEGDITLYAVWDEE